MHLSSPHVNPDGTNAHLIAGAKIGKNVYIHPTAKVGFGCKIADNVIIEEKVVIAGFAIIEDNCIIGAGSYIDSWKNGVTTIKHGAIIPPKTNIEVGTTIPENFGTEQETADAG